MVVEHISFDPEGDLLLHLTYPPEKEEQATEKPQDESMDVDMNGGQAAGTGVSAATAINLDEQPTQCKIEAPSKMLPQKQSHMLVSAKSLMLASPVFKAMLQNGNFREGQELLTGRADLTLPEDDPVAWKVLLNIIHYRAQEVPREVDLKTMSNLSILVDKYQMFGVIGIYSDFWIPQLLESMPSTLTLDLPHWLSVAWVFRLSTEFKTLTRILKWESVAGLATVIGEELPIPGSVFTSIEAGRQQSISDALFTVQDVIDKYHTSSIICNKGFSANKADKQLACDGLVLGSLLKSLKTNGMWPIPKPPYPDSTLASIVRKIRSLKIAAICDAPFHPHWIDKEGKPVTYPAAHGHMDSIRNAMDELEAQVGGLDLRDFV